MKHRNIMPIGESFPMITGVGMTTTGLAKLDSGPSLV
jgi:hypothetical protein